MKLKRDLVLVDVKNPNMTEAGIHLPPDAEQDLVTADVLQVGPGVYAETGELIKPDVEPGDRVVIHVDTANGGIPVKLGDRKLTLVREPAILFCLEEGESLGR